MRSRCSCIAIYICVCNGFVHELAGGLLAAHPVFTSAEVSESHLVPHISFLLKIYDTLDPAVQGVFVQLHIQIRYHKTTPRLSISRNLTQTSPPQARLAAAYIVWTDVLFPRIMAEFQKPAIIYLTMIATLEPPPLTSKKSLKLMNTMGRMTHDPAYAIQVQPWIRGRRFTGSRDEMGTSSMGVVKKPRSMSWGRLDVRRAVYR
jgi:hypothetical protein